VAALRGGRPVYFYVGAEDAPDRGDADRDDPFAPSALETVVSTAVVAGLVLTCVFWLMRRNLRQGRADIRGAWRFAFAVLAIHLFLWAVTARHVAIIGAEVYGGFAWAVGRGVVGGALAGVGYLALEPGVRRRWPWRLVAWSRLLDGQWRNPLVGRDLLIGAAAGVAMNVISQIQCLATGAFGQPVVLISFGPLAFIGGVPWLALGLLRASSMILNFYVLFVLTALTRRQWIGATLWFGLLFLFTLDTVDRPPIEAPFVAAWVGVSLYILMRFGLLAYLVTTFCRVVLYSPMFTFDTDAWHVIDGAIPATVVALIAAFGCYTSTGGRLFKEGIFGDD
jgi:serine/threonine-protein kinase